MNILLATGIYPPEVGGPATYTAGMAAALRKQGHVVRVVAYGDGYPSEADVMRVSRKGGAVLRYFRYAWHVFCLARKSNLVYAQGPVSEGLPATIGAWFARKPLVMKVVGDYAWEMAQQKGEKTLLDEFLQTKHTGIVRFYERIERWTVRRARFVIVPSRYLAGVVEQWGVPSSQLHVVLNAIETLPPTRGRDEERRAFG
ncbi:MAG: glycosyltransferase family 4 protein, partial [bacterium]|nr:glycosyltransferase family 4 protein [bacterium]